MDLEHLHQLERQLHRLQWMHVDFNGLARELGPVEKCPLRPLWDETAGDFIAAVAAELERVRILVDEWDHAPAGHR